VKNENIIIRKSILVTYKMTSLIPTNSYIRSLVFTLLVISNFSSVLLAIYLLSNTDCSIKESLACTNQVVYIPIGSRYMYAYDLTGTENEERVVLCRVNCKNTVDINSCPVNGSSCDLNPDMINYCHLQHQTNCFRWSYFLLGIVTIMLSIALTGLIVCIVIIFLQDVEYQDYHILPIYGHM
jgi:hypothetical protein